jgi:hypothetical protein
MIGIVGGEIITAVGVDAGVVDAGVVFGVVFGVVDIFEFELANGLFLFDV